MKRVRLFLIIVLCATIILTASYWFGWLIAETLLWLTVHPGRLLACVVGSVVVWLCWNISGKLANEP